VKRLLDVPSWQAGRVRLADFAELLTVQAADRSVSTQDIIEALSRLGEEDETRYEQPVLDAFDELSQRSRHVGAGEARYPYKVEGEELRLRLRMGQSDASLLYFFLLLATVGNMLREKVQAGLDGTELFEQLCLEIARRYWGAHSDTRVKTMLFGTARSAWRENDEAQVPENRFATAVNDLCAALGEGVRFRKKDPGPIRSKDDRLDVVVWRRFADQRAGNLIGFGQCKTGTSWEHELPRLSPSSFCNRWFDTNPVHLPVKLFFLTDRVAENWTTRSYDAGILFDRCRILEYADDLPPALLKACGRWTRSLLGGHGLALP
jgi:hypothetical protein